MRKILILLSAIFFNTALASNSIPILINNNSDGVFSLSPGFADEKDLLLAHTQKTILCKSKPTSPSTSICDFDIYYPGATYSTFYAAFYLTSGRLYELINKQNPYNFYSTVEGSTLTIHNG